MSKNLLMIHLESLNQVIYRMNPDLFPNISHIAKESYGFNKYFSSATSTIMVAADMMDGGTYQYEKNTKVVDERNEIFPKEFLLDELSERGFFVKKYAYPIDPCDAEWNLAIQKRFFGRRLQVDSFEKEQDLFDRLKEDLKGNGSFAVWCCDYISNMASRGLVIKDRRFSGSQLWRMGYRMMDDFVGKLLEILAQTNHIEDTIVVLYGDHGDEFWGKRFHGGLVHAIEPYAELIHTPLWIWGKGEEGGESNKLLSTVDMKYLIMRLLSDETVVVSQLAGDRKYVFARNEYAAQSCRTESFNKSYCVTDGILLLMVSGLGLEMYDMEMDPGCKCNYLLWFKLEKEVLKFKKSILRERTYHFASFMNQREITIIRQKFYRLKKLLYSFVCKCYISAGLGEKTVQQEMDFQSIRCD